MELYFLPTSFGLFANNIFTALLTHPNFMLPPCRDINSGAYTKGLFGRIFVPRIRYCQCASPDEMGGETAVRVGWIMCVSRRKGEEMVRAIRWTSRPRLTGRLRRRRLKWQVRRSRLSIVFEVWCMRRKEI